ncbi:MAG: hypothetical protein M5R36_25840 [Deltaproteobacteria bacterium]|nr:hypothetical protein [Deltaproteobacteria bacterium]
MGTKTIYETKATCKACGNVWHFGKSNTPVAGGTCGQPQPQNTGCGSPPQKSNRVVAVAEHRNLLQLPKKVTGARSVVPQLSKKKS